MPVAETLVSYCFAAEPGAGPEFVHPTERLDNFLAQSGLAKTFAFYVVIHQDPLKKQHQ